MYSERLDQQAGHGEGPPPGSYNPMSRIEFERLFGGRVLAWVGGLATLLGVVFLMRSAVDSSWFTEEVRALLAAVGSLLLLGIGVWLHERKGHIELGRLLVAVAIPGLYATTVVATQTYDLISPVLGLEARGADRTRRGRHRRALVLDARRQRRDPRRPGRADPRRHRQRGRLDRLRRRGARRRRRRPPLAALGVARARRLRRLGSPAHRLDRFERVHHPRGRARPESARSARPRGPGRVLGPLRGGRLRLRAAQPRRGAPAGFLLAAAPLRQRVRRRRRCRRDRRRLVARPRRLDLRLRRRPSPARRARRSASASTAKSVRSSSAAGSGWRPSASPAPSTAPRSSPPGPPRPPPSPISRPGSTRRRHAALSDAKRLLLAACGFLGLAIAHVLVVEAPPTAIAEGVADLGSSLVAIASCAIAALACWHFGRQVDRRVATVAGFVGATGLVYLGSVLIIDAIGADDAGEAREIGQSWLSAFWAAAGLGAVDRRHGPAVRRTSASAAWRCWRS